MNDETENNGWPGIAGDPKSLPAEISPPGALEDRVVNTLLSRNLIQAHQPAGSRSLRWRVAWASLAAAFCIALLGVGVFIGQTGAGRIPGSLTTLTGAETDLYALLLFETAGYDRPAAEDAMSRFGEYSDWIAMARARDQFVTGEDLESGRGWLLTPNKDEVEISNDVAVAGSVPLSGVLFVRAASVEQALELAKALPHIRHGGSVVVQKTLRTDVPTIE